MPVSATGTATSNLRRARGFTLLELLVVLFIIGLLTSLVLLSTGIAGVERRLQDDAARLAARLELASEEAVLTGRELAASFDTDGYLFMVAEGGEWAPVRSGALAGSVRLGAGTRVDLRIEGSSIDLEDPAVRGEPHILLYSSGEVSPFDLEIGNGASDVRFRVVHGAGSFAVRRSGEEYQHARR